MIKESSLDNKGSCTQLEVNTQDNYNEFLMRIKYRNLENNNTEHYYQGLKILNPFSVPTKIQLYENVKNITKEVILHLINSNTILFDSILEIIFLDSFYKLYEDQVLYVWTKQDIIELMEDVPNILKMPRTMLEKSEKPEKNYNSIW